VAEGTPETLGGRSDGKSLIRFALPDGVALDRIPVSGATRREGLVELETETPTRALHELTGWALENGVDLERLQVSRPSLEDVYLELTGDA
jgi:ABC-2 type transport system ATP-binding protein